MNNDDDIPSLPSEPTLRPGSDGSSLGRVDHCDLVRKLGGGGFGVVYLARDTASGVEVALKTLHPLLKTNAEEMERLREKFALVSRLSHPNIASALELHPCREVNVWDESARRELRLSPGDSVMVMRYAPGVTLSKWRRQFPDGRAPLDQTLEIARQVASALDYAHGERIVHRDIKPSNVMVETLDVPSAGADDAAMRNGGASRPGEPKVGRGVTAEPEVGRGVPAEPHSGVPAIRVQILDFGLAAEIRSSMARVSAETGDTSGTRPYMAPEQWLGRKQDGRTDQYALACVLYELLGGEPPFAGVFETGDPIIMKDAVVRDAPEEIEGLPPAVNAALLKALAKKPQERFGSCAAFVEALAAPANPESRIPPQPAAPDSLNPQDDVPPGTFSAALEADVLRRELTLSHDLKTIPEAIRSDREFSRFVSTAEGELAVAEKASKLGRFPAAAESLNRAESALDELRKARFARVEVERKAKEEAERLAQEEAERLALEEEERLAREKAEAERRRLSERRAREAARAAEAERAAREEASRKAEERKRRRGIGLWVAALAALFVAVATNLVAYGVRSVNRLRPARQTAAALAKPGHRNPATETRPLVVGAHAGELKTVSIGSQTIRLHWCPPGTFTMGSPSTEDGRGEDETRHRVTLTQGFWMGETEVTQGLWEEVMGGNPSHFNLGSNYPVECVSWDDCQDFIAALNRKAPVAGCLWALPTEAQWEYACRAGTTDAYFWGNALNGDHANCDGNYPCDTAVKGPYRQKTMEVGSYAANPWGLYDMHGNVWEWCQDGYGAYPSGAVTNPTGASSGSRRVTRGGSWYSYARCCRSARREWDSPGFRRYLFGLRITLAPVQ